jgi:hypothetical protein
VAQHGEQAKDYQYNMPPSRRHIAHGENLSVHKKTCAFSSYAQKQSDVKHIKAARIKHRTHYDHEERTVLIGQRWG